MFLGFQIQNQLFRHTGLNKSISGSLVANNLLWFMHRFPPMHSQISQLQPDSRSPEEGAATPLHCALAPSLANTTGVLLKRLQEEEIEAFASDQVFLETCFLMFLTICLDFGEEDGGSQQILGWAA